MQNRPADLITERLAGWSPSPEAQRIIVWRILQMLLTRYGSIPLGQLLVSMTTLVLNELGRAPTVTELCEATGLPKSSISRYISAQMEQDLITETIDPADRRRRLLSQTDAGKAERRWELRQMRKILDQVHTWDQQRAAGGEVNPDDELEAMKAVARGESPEPFHPKSKRRTAAA